MSTKTTTTTPTPTSTSRDREEWLGRALTAFESLVLFPKRGICLPPARISCGWPRSSRGKRSGYAYPADLSADGNCEVFVSPEIADPAEALAVTWTHAVSVSQGCNLTARQLAAETSALFGVDLSLFTPSTAVDYLLGKAEFREALQLLGPYPHGAFNSQRKVAATRLLKLEHSCGWVVRASASQAEKIAPGAACPVCDKSGGWKLSGTPVS